MESSEFRLRFLCGACGAFEFVDGCILAVREQCEGLARRQRRGEAAAGQRRGVGGAETTGSLRAFSRGTPRMIALKEEAWYRALTLQTLRAFECVVPIMRDRVKNSPRPDRSRRPPRDNAFLLPGRWPSGNHAMREKPPSS